MVYNESDDSFYVIGGYENGGTGDLSGNAFERRSLSKISPQNLSKVDTIRSKMDIGFKIYDQNH